MTAFFKNILSFQERRYDGISPVTFEGLHQPVAFKSQLPLFQMEEYVLKSTALLRGACPFFYLWKF